VTCCLVDGDQAHLEVYTRVMTGAAVVLAGREMMTECASCLAAVASAFARHRNRLALAAGAGLTPGTLGLMIHAVLSSIGGMGFFLASLHPFTRGVSTTFVRSFLGPRQILQPEVHMFRQSCHGLCFGRDVADYIATGFGNRLYCIWFSRVLA
jgi:hypothetical protein